MMRSWCFLELKRAGHGDSGISIPELSELHQMKRHSACVWGRTQIWCMQILKDNSVGRLGFLCSNTNSDAGTAQSWIELDKETRPGIPMSKLHWMKRPFVWVRKHPDRIHAWSSGQPGWSGWQSFRHATHGTNKNHVDNYDADAFTNSTVVNQDLRLTRTSKGCSGVVNTVITAKALNNGESRL